jgi:hypothetical protein
MRDVIAIAMPNVRSILVGGDFNTNTDEFATEVTLKALEDAGFANCMAKLPVAARVTHPGSHGYPDTTFDYLFALNATVGPPQITPSTASDHLPVTCDITVRSAPAVATVAAVTPNVLPPSHSVTITQPVEIEVLYGKTVIPRGLKLPVVKRDTTTVWVRYMDETYPIAISSTDLHH